MKMMRVDLQQNSADNLVYITNIPDTVNTVIRGLVYQTVPYMAGALDNTGVYTSVPSTHLNCHANHF